MRGTLDCVNKGICLAALVFFAGCASHFPPVAGLPLRPQAPDPLVMQNGRRVTTSEEWRTQRVPELKRLFQHYMYGWLPPSVSVHGEVTYTDTNFFNGKATLKLVTVKIGTGISPEVHLMIVLPHAKKPVPIFLGMNFSGNHTLVADTNVPVTTGWMPPRLANVVSNKATAAARGKETNTWALEQTIDRGYGVATYYCGDVEQDRTNAEGGVQELVYPRRAPDSWGTIAAWAWGMQRMVDYLCTDSDVDSSRIAVVGHSRFGKASILAAAFDERIALAIPLQSGCGGTAPSRTKTGETVKQINDHLPNWFCPVFKQFNGQPERLPFDQDCLIALCAPRPVLLGAAKADTWADPAGTFEMLKAAQDAYRLMGVEGLSETNFPPLNHLIDSNLGYFIRAGKHSMTRQDWQMFLDFADKHLAEKPRS